MNVNFVNIFVTQMNYINITSNLLSTAHMFYNTIFCKVDIFQRKGFSYLYFILVIYVVCQIIFETYIEYWYKLLVILHKWLTVKRRLGVRIKPYNIHFSIWMALVLVMLIYGLWNKEYMLVITNRRKTNFFQIQYLPICSHLLKKYNSI